MSNLVNYKGFSIPQPIPANLGGGALANNLKWLGMTSTPHVNNDTTPVIGFTTEYDHAGNKMFERELHAETRSSLYQPFDEKD